MLQSRSRVFRQDQRGARFHALFIENIDTMQGNAKTMSKSLHVSATSTEP